MSEVLSLENVNLKRFEELLKQTREKGASSKSIEEVSTLIIEYLKGYRKNTELKKQIDYLLEKLLENEAQLFVTSGFLQELADIKFLNPESVEKLKTKTRQILDKEINENNSIRVNTQSKIILLLAGLNKTATLEEKKQQINSLFEILKNPDIHFLVKTNTIKAITEIGSTLPPHQKTEVIKALSEIKSENPSILNSRDSALVKIQTKTNK